MPGKYSATKAFTTKVTLFILLGVLLISILIFISELLQIDSVSAKNRSTRRLAELYLSAILDGDRERAIGLIRLEVLCSGAGMEQEVDKHLALFESAAVRNITIDVQDLTGSVAYSPGTEGADIRFEYKRPGDMEWRVGELGFAAVDHSEQGSDFRYICWLWTAGEE